MRSAFRDQLPSPAQAERWLIVSVKNKFLEDQQRQLQQRKQSEAKAAKAKELEDKERQAKGELYQLWNRAYAYPHCIKQVCYDEAINKAQTILDRCGKPDVGDALFGKMNEATGEREPRFFNLKAEYSPESLLRNEVPKTALRGVGRALSEANAARRMDDERLRNETIRRMRELVTHLHSKNWLRHLHELYKLRPREDRRMLLAISDGVPDSELGDFDLDTIRDESKFLTTWHAMDQRIWPAEQNSEERSQAATSTTNPVDSGEIRVANEAKEVASMIPIPKATANGGDKGSRKKAGRKRATADKIIEACKVWIEYERERRTYKEFCEWRNGDKKVGRISEKWLDGKLSWVRKLMKEVPTRIPAEFADKLKPLQRVKSAPKEAAKNSRRSR